MTRVRPSRLRLGPRSRYADGVSAKNVYHDAVRAALVADGWTITHDPLAFKVGERDLFVDLGAERLPIGAEKDGVRIAVEVQSFLARSDVRSLQQAVGQYIMYRAALSRQQPDRRLYLAVPGAVYDGIMAEELGQITLADSQVALLVFDPDRGEVLRWAG